MKLTSAQYRRLKGNKKSQIKKHVRHGEKFDSGLEMFMFELLKAHKIDFKFQVMYELVEGFTYCEKKIRPMTLTVDFVIGEEEIIIDTKGFQREDNKLKWKILKSKLSQAGKHIPIYFPSNQKECREMLSLIQSR